MIVEKVAENLRPHHFKLAREKAKHLMQLNIFEAAEKFSFQNKKFLKIADNMQIFD